MSPVASPVSERYPRGLQAWGGVAAEIGLVFVSLSDLLGFYSVTRMATQGIGCCRSTKERRVTENDLSSVFDVNLGSRGLTSSSLLSVVSTVPSPSSTLLPSSSALPVHSSLRNSGERHLWNLLTRVVVS